jgi:homoserine dehydrogenase
LATSQVLDDSLFLRVAPTLTPKNSPLATVAAEFNAIRIVGDAVGEVFLEGRGAGRMPTASAVVADVVDIATGRAMQSFPAMRLDDPNPPGPKVARGKFLSSRFYMRFAIVDRPGVLAKLAAVLGSKNISIASVIQHESREDMDEAVAPLIIMTHQADEQAVQDALSEIDALAETRAPSVYLHVAG